MSDQLDMFAPTARVTDPVTSHIAAGIAAQRAPNMRQRALIALHMIGPLTDFELADALSTPLRAVHQTSIGVRRGELAKVGLVAPVAGVFRPTPTTGSPAQVWYITSAGEAEVQELRSA